MPSAASIHEEVVYEIPEVETTPVNVTEAAGRMLAESGNPCGVEMIQAPAVWNLGHTGEGVYVGMIDSGVRVTHEALKNKYLGDFSWYDMTDKKTAPYDDPGHGTHVLGTIIGDRVGVAPGATWLAYKGCKNLSCTQSATMSLMQSMTCPTDTKGKKKYCSKAPHVVNNLWAGPPDGSIYQAAIDAWHAVGIIPVFALGNTGASGCGTANSPGDYASVIGVGATDWQDKLAALSSKDPVPDGHMKPDISAPGTSIYSASVDGDEQYALKSGTSMAAPHVTGAIALVISANQVGISFDDVLQVLTKSTASKKLEPSGYSCGGSNASPP